MNLSRFKTPQVWGYLIGIIAIIVISFCFFYPDAVQGNELRQYDMLQGRAIGQEAKAFQDATGETTRWTNSLFGGMPTFQISPTYPSNSLFAWIGTVYGCGLPAPANLLCMMMLGFLILMMAMKVKPLYGTIGAIAYGLSTYFIIIIGAGHIWKFVTLAYVPPTIAGIVLAYRGRYVAGSALAAVAAMMQIAANHVQMTYYFAFVVLGLVIAYLVAAIREKSVKRWCIATGSLAVAAVLAVAANLPSLYNTYEYSKETMRGSHSELTQADAPAQSTGGLDRDYITQYSYGPSELFSLFIPNIKGGASARPHQGQMQQVTLADLPEAQDMVMTGRVDGAAAQYLSYSSQYFGDPEGTNGPVYVGAVVFALFLLGCIIVKGPVKWSLVALTVLSLLLALGRHFMSLTDLFIDFVPMYSKFRTVESILVIAEFTIPLLAILGLQKLLTERRPLREVVKPLAVAFGVPALFCLIGIVSPGFFGSAITENDMMISQQITDYVVSQGYDAAQANMLTINNPEIAYVVQSLRYKMVSDDSLRSLIFLLAAAAAFALFLGGKMPKSVKPLGVGAFIGLLVLADLYPLNKRYLNHDSFCPPEMSLVDPLAPNQTDLAIMADTTSHYRMMNIPQFFSPAPSYNHKAIGGYHAAKLTRYQDLIDRHLVHFTQASPTDADYNIVNMLNGRYFVMPNGHPAQNPDALGNAWFVDTLVYADGPDAEMDALDLINPATTAVADKKFHDVLGDMSTAIIAPGDTIRLTSYAPNRLTYSATSAKGGLAVFSEVYFPWGWKAEIDGTPADIARVNYVLRAMKIPAGHHTVTMTFDPQSLHTTGTVATVAIILIYLLVLGAIVVMLKRNPNPTSPKEGEAS